MTTKKKKTLNVGVLGVGRIGKLHARNVRYGIPQANLVAVADVNIKAAKACAQELEIQDAYESPQAILDDKNIEAVLICTSTDTHSRLIEECAAAGKQIFCEKPIDYDLGKIDSALAAVKKAGVKLQIGFNRRFDPNFHCVQKGVASGNIGAPHLLRITSRDPAPPPIEYVKVSGGIFFDMTIHDFDMARYLAGSEVKKVYASGAVLVDPKIGKAGDIDTATISLEFANGALGVIDNSRQAVYGYDQRVEVFGAKGMLAADNNTPTRTVFCDKKGVHSPLPLYFFLERYNDSFIAELQMFVNAVLNDKEPPVGGADGRAAVVIAMAAQRSYKEKRPVELKEIKS